MVNNYLKLGLKDEKFICKYLMILWIMVLVMVGQDENVNIIMNPI